VIKLEHISKLFDKTRVLEDLSLTINRGEFFTLLGPSGCGKTTTLRIIAGFIYPDSGNVLLNGRDVSRLPPEKRGLGMVFQNYALFPHMTVAENITFGLKVRRFSREQIRERVEKYLQLVRLEGYHKRRIAQLSGGQQQRVAVARALAIEPEILLLDEPLSNLDAKLREEMRGEIRSIQRQLGIAMVYVTHDQAEALAMSDRIAVFQNGTCTQIGSPEEIYHRPVNPFIANFVGTANIIPCKILQAGPDKILVEALGSRISLPSPGPRDLEEPGYLSVRPEGLEPCEPALADFTGEVEDVVFNGTLVYIRVRAVDMAIQVHILNDGAGDIPPVHGEIGLRIKKQRAFFVAGPAGVSHA
jgi:iron(III) transport system ATP-binding protein